MNPFPLAAANLRRFRRTALALVALIALATATGTGITALDRASRTAAAAAADAFDLVIGAPGGPAQLVLTAVYLQPDTVPLLDPAATARILAEPGVAWSSPIGFGDQHAGHPVVGVAPAFLSRPGADGRPTRAMAEGKPFADEDEAVIGATVALKLGDSFSPAHGLVELPDHANHVHAETKYTVVGRLPPTGTPWDNAILVPIESVWEVHGLGNGHEEGVERVGPPWEKPAGVPAIVVKPRSIGDAYQLRNRYRGTASTAVFPGEVLSSLFRTLGDIRALLTGVATACTVLVVAAVFLAFIALLGTRRRDLAVLRALGAPPAFLLAATWIELGALLLAGTAAGLLCGYAAAALGARLLSRATGAAVSVVPAVSDLGLPALVLVAGLLAALLTALVSTRGSPAELLKR